MGVRVPSSANFLNKKVGGKDFFTPVVLTNNGGLPVRVSCSVRLISSPTLQDESPSSANFLNKKVGGKDFFTPVVLTNNGGLPVRVSCSVRLISSPTLQDEFLSSANFLSRSPRERAGVRVDYKQN